MIRLDVFSDPVCPWCFVGKAALDMALAAHPGHGFQIAWQPFQLNPDMPPAGVDRRAYLAAKFGDRAGLDRAHARLRQMAAEAGVAMDPERPARIPNTLDAHRLIHWAGLEGRQGALVTALFDAYWQAGRDIGDPATLALIAGSAGMDEAMVARLLASDAGADDILARDADARTKGVSAVPTFLIDDKYVLSGAQPAAMWALVIAELAGLAAARA